MEPAADEAAAPEAIRFRPGRKRKAYRQRNDVDVDVAQQPSPGAVVPEPSSSRPEEARKAADDDDDDDNEEQESAVAAAIRLRNARRGKLRGVGFRSDARLEDESNGEQALVLRNQDDGLEKEAPIGGISERFMHQTGILADLNDRHMTAYIESRLSSRHAPAGTTKQQEQQQQQRPPGEAGASRPGEAPTATIAEALAAVPTFNQSTKHGKLFEVDVPSDAWNQGAKKRRVDDSSKPAKPPRRGRNRRNSEDIKRDQLVEQFLHENRLDVYDVPAASAAATSAAPGDDGEADERLAEQFRQQYLDELAQRRKKKKVVPPTRQQQPTEDVLKGPKLGGSRNQRAAVRDLLLLKQEKEKKGR